MNFLSKEAWEQFRKLNRVPACFFKKETEDSNRTKGINKKKYKNESNLTEDKIKIPEIMVGMIFTTTATVCCSTLE